MRDIDITKDWMNRWVKWEPERYKTGATSQTWYCKSGETVLETYEAVRKTAMGTIPNCPPIELYDCVTQKSDGRQTEWARPCYPAAAYCFVPTLLRKPPECFIVAICLETHRPFYSAIWRAVPIPHDTLTLTMDWDVYYEDSMPSYETTLVWDDAGDSQVRRPVGYTEAFGAPNREAQYLSRALQRMILSTLYIPGL